MESETVQDRKRSSMMPPLVLVTGGCRRSDWEKQRKRGSLDSHHRHVRGSSTAYVGVLVVRGSSVQSTYLSGSLCGEDTNNSRQTGRREPLPAHHCLPRHARYLHPLPSAFPSSEDRWIVSLHLPTSTL
ncbi:hypothetical protein E2C01_041891 [Portunus trituberculatus]|uniref:Uncharacterized protein n=1 Tax=Portunus trituberculatus TaxID=210409 RepID=A0A5B7FRW7_PORTR|nr:hypothetical protein [Portunus trituberculatus]